jgi:hypothetical protein
MVLEALQCAELSISHLAGPTPSSRATRHTLEVVKEVLEALESPVISISHLAGPM